jgi:hypothetical protein
MEGNHRQPTNSTNHGDMSHDMGTTHRDMRPHMNDMNHDMPSTKIGMRIK